MSAALATVAALLAARTTGQGRYVDIAMTDVVLAHNYFPLLHVLAGGPALQRGNDLFSGRVPGYGVYPTADGRFMAVGALEEKFWSTLCCTLQRPDLLPLGLAEGAEGADARAELAKVFRTRTQAEWVGVFGEVDCCVSPVLRPEESLEDPHLRARATVVAGHDGLEVGSPLRMEGRPRRAAEPAPTRGADSEALLREAGYAPGEIASLREKGVI
jgi:crotonobetainyl-CoA:carnitine CoA-transferase CaiB-like acyl-CoA transferase